MMIRSRIETEYLKLVSNPKPELEDVMIMSMIVFMQIIYNIHRSTLEEWDHSSLKSRIALAVSCGLSIKFQMDVEPYGSLCFLKWVVRPGEIEFDCQEALQHYIINYELVVIKSISLYRCSFNHRIWAIEFLLKLKDNREISMFTTNRIYEVLYFVCFNSCELLPVYTEYDKKVMAEAIVLLSIQCIECSASGGAITKSRILCAKPSYELASKIGHKIAEKSGFETQHLLGDPFANKTEWQHQATQPCTIRRAAYDLERKKQMALGSDRKQQCPVVS